MDLQRKLLGIGDTLAHCSRIKMIFENEYGKEWMLPIISRPFPSLSTDTFARFSTLLLCLLREKICKFVLQSLERIIFDDF